MGKMSDEAGRRVGRRAFLRKTAVVGTGAWAMPAIITLTPASAQALTSPPPEPPDRPESVAPGAQPGAAAGTPPGKQAAGTEVAGRTELPRTGADIDRLVVAGLAATAGGAALMLWSADAKPKSATDASADPEPET